jgi:hypothetical protein
MDLDRWNPDIWTDRKTGGEIDGKNEQIDRKIDQLTDIWT